MAEITQDITLGQALDLAQSRATEANEKNAAKNISQFKNAITKGKLGENVTLESPYFTTVKGKDYLTNIQAGKGKVETDFYVKAQALEKYTNQALVESGLTDLTTDVTGATGLAKTVGAKGQLRGEQAMRGMIPFAEIDKIYAEGFDEMKGDKKVSDATKDFLMYHRYTSHRVGTILNDTEDYKSLRLSDISVITDNDGNTSVSIKGEVRGKKRRYATTYTGSFAEFLKGVYNKAKSANPDMPNSEIKLFNTSQAKVNEAWKKYLLPKFLDRHEISLPVDRKGKVVTGLTEIIRSANIEALESDLGLASNLGDDFMGHTAQGTKAKSYKVNTPESKEIGRITENMVKTSTFNLGKSSVNDLFADYGLNTPTLNVENENVKVYDGHKSDFKFSQGALTESIVGRKPTKEDIQLAKERNITNIKKQKLLQTDIEIEDLSKQEKRLKLKAEVEDLTKSQKIKQIEKSLEDQELKKEVKENKKLIENKNAWKTIDPATKALLIEQGLWDDITEGKDPETTDKKPSKVSKAVKGALTASAIAVSKATKATPIVGDFLSGTEEYQRAIKEGDPQSVAISKGVAEVSPISPSMIRDAETLAKKGAEATVEKSMESGDSNVGFMEGLMGQFGYPTGGGFSSGGFINKNQSRR